MPDMRSSNAQRISVCLATFKRNERLSAVLLDLARQELLPNQIVIVDNDPAAGAKATVAQFTASGVPFQVDYDVQPVPNIAITRNRSVELASGQWLAFIDDDERAPTNWLRELMHAVKVYQADAVLAPVEPEVPADAPKWIRRGRFYDFPHQPEGAEVPLNCMRFGNLVVRGDLLRTEEHPFDPRHGLMGGEDLDTLVRLVHKGAKVVWTEKAPVYEAVEPKRLSLRYLALRALGGGQGFARYTLAGGFGNIGWPRRAIFVFQVVAQLLMASALSLLALPFGRHHAAAWVLRASANYGKLTALWGGSYHAYGRHA
jgi:succinoglycan biosynthesis protein ExoM